MLEAELSILQSTVEEPTVRNRLCILHVYGSLDYGYEIPENGTTWI